MGDFRTMRRIGSLLTAILMIGFVPEIRFIYVRDYIKVAGKLPTKKG
jgi:hypothetical protein